MSERRERKKRKKPDLPFHGDSTCQDRMKTGSVCTRRAYHYSTSTHQVYCGVHRKTHKTLVLPKDPNRKKRAKQEQKDRDQVIETTAAQNKARGQTGTLTLQRMKMMKNPHHTPGVRLVFPNFKHQNRVDGFGCASLSPKSMGPVLHGQPGLPVAMNLENFHQGNKVFPSEYKVSTDTIRDDFFRTQQAMYEDKAPHRHKEAAKSVSGKNKNLPLFSLWMSPDGTTHRVSYVRSRQFYCHFYEQFALADKNFRQLQTWLTEGYNLELVGFDAFVPDKDLSVHYLDDSRPFGHELVLYSMLMGQRPWALYKEPLLWNRCAVPRSLSESEPAG